MPQDLLIESEQAQRHRLVRLLSAAIIALTVIAYAPAFSADFITFDDFDYVVENPMFRDGLTWATVVRCFTQFHSANWHPLTWLSHLLDITIYGMDPAGHHATNVLMHLVGALVLFRLLDRWTGATVLAGVVGLMYALHPVQVESVAWVSERKNVLSMLLGLICLWAYTSYALKPTIGRYLLVLLWLALMSKPMMVTWPCVMLLLDVWPLGRTRYVPAAGGLSAASPPPPSIARLVIEKLPMFALVAGACVLTLQAQNSFGGLDSEAQAPLVARLINGVVAYARYLGIWLWPVNLGVLYPIVPHWPVAVVAGSAFLLTAISVACLVLFRRAPYLLIGWCWFLGTMVPVLGVIQVGAQSIADRYMQVPIVGLLFAAVLGVRDAVRRWPALHKPAVALAVALTLAYTVATFRQASLWTDSITLFEHTIAVTPPNPRMHFAMSGAHMREGQMDHAVAHMQRAAQLAPTDGFIRAGLATLLARDRPDPVVLEHLRAAVHHSWRDPRVLGMVIAVYERINMPEAAAHYRAKLAELQKGL